jgi:RNA polymerase sigma-70 factor (ECF subfamily)
MRPGQTETHQAIERAARESYARLLAFLASRSGDLSAAEDALGDAFKSALETWPTRGVPANPVGWLLTAARRRLIDAARHARVQANAVPSLVAAADEAQGLASLGGGFPDERLKVLFICAHPAIDPAIRTPLMLQIVLGLDAARIASAFVMQPAAMGQRLSRAKAKMRTARMRFGLPEADDLPPRLDAVLEAIYAAYGSGWDDLTGADPRRRGLPSEALELTRVLARLMPAQPEVHGLLALMLHCEARRAARRSAAGEYVPLAEQDVRQWSGQMLEEAETHLYTAAQAEVLGRFHLEAAIQSAHAQRARTGRTDWQAVAVLYEGLVRLAPRLGALVGRAAAVAEAHGPASGWALVEAIPQDAAAGYQPYWAVSAHILARLGRAAEARAAYARAIDLSQDAAVRAWLASQAEALRAARRP